MRGVCRSLLALGLGLLAGCGEADAPDDALEAIRAPEIVRIVAAQDVLAGAHVPTLDPSTMNDAEIRKAIGAGARCEFRYTSTGRPVLAMEVGQDGAAHRGVVKLNGSLVLLELAPTELASAADEVGRAEGIALVAESIRASIVPVSGDLTEIRGGLPTREATLVFEVGTNLQAGYRGYLECAPEPPPE